MRKSYCIVLMGFALYTAQAADARVKDLRSTADGESMESAAAAAKRKLIKACKKRNGRSDLDSFRVLSEDKIVHPEIRRPYQVEAILKCDGRDDGAAQGQAASNI